VLGPGSDGYHEDHVHVDLAERRGGYRVCEWDVREPPAHPPSLAGEGSVAAAAIIADPVPLPVPLPRARPIDAR
jgi:hypothetical protein